MVNSAAIGDGERMWKRRVLLNICSVVLSLDSGMLGVTAIGKVWPETKRFE